MATNASHHLTATLGLRVLSPFLWKRTGSRLRIEADFHGAHHWVQPLRLDPLLMASHVLFPFLSPPGSSGSRFGVGIHLTEINTQQENTSLAVQL